MSQPDVIVICTFLSGLHIGTDFSVREREDCYCERVEDVIETDPAFREDIL